MKRAIIVHGWGGNHEEGWFPWLKTQCEKRGYITLVPDMPDTEHPTISAWVGVLKEVVGKPDEELLLLGHSIGCQTILRYLEQLPAGERVGKCIFVAGFFNLQWLESDEAWQQSKPWLETPIDTGKVTSHCNNFVAFFSDNDQFVGLDNKEAFEKRLGAKTTVVHMGHFSHSDGITQLPLLLPEL